MVIIACGSKIAYIYLLVLFNRAVTTTFETNLAVQAEYWTNLAVQAELGTGCERISSRDSQPGWFCPDSLVLLSVLGVAVDYARKAATSFLVLSMPLYCH